MAHEEVIEEDEEDYDQEDIDAMDEEDDDDPEHILQMNMRHDRRIGAAQNDIINFGVQRVNAHDHHNWGQRIAERRVEVRQQLDWSEEETQVQRILNNLRGSQPNVNVPAGPPRGINFDPRGVQPIDDNAVGSIIKQTYEDFKVISEKELYDMVLQQNHSFEVALPPAPVLNRPAGRDLNPLERYR